ncbi:MAG: SRPBCC domain-containing protein [Actinobacteria bacterium]|nr:SRPBCC domain-containing protein [Actinomycetota bacterium]
MPDILHQVVINARPSAVYRALTEPGGLASWWTADVDAEPELGSVARFGFDGRSTVFMMKIEELEADEFVRWHCVGGHPEWEHTEITFDLSPADDPAGGTVLYFAHRGWESTDGILAMCSFDWARYLMSLRAYLETGTGSPHSGKPAG